MTELRRCVRWDPVTGGEIEVWAPVSAPAQPGESVETAPLTLGEQLDLQRNINHSLELELAEVKAEACEIIQDHKACSYEDIPEGCCMGCQFWCQR
jgi:hypothetical protein